MEEHLGRMKYNRCWGTAIEILATAPVYTYMLAALITQSIADSSVRCINCKRQLEFRNVTNSETALDYNGNILCSINMS